MPTMNGEDHRVITFDDEEINDLFNGDENFAKQLSEEYFFGLMLYSMINIL